MKVMKFKLRSPNKKTMTKNKTKWITKDSKTIKTIFNSMMKIWMKWMMALKKKIKMVMMKINRDKRWMMVVMEMKTKRKWLRSMKTNLKLYFSNINVSWMVKMQENQSVTRMENQFSWLKKSMKQQYISSKSNNRWICEISLLY